MIQLGITGGIGSGKSTVCKVFASLGIPINDADSLAKKIIVEDPELKESIIQQFGSEAYFDNGDYNRTYISKIVFNNAEKLSILNSLVHPKVIAYSKKWTEKHAHHPYVIKEAALMFESGSYKANDYNIVVEAPLDIRIQRICIRDNAIAEDVLKRIQAQLSDDERREKADLIIYNDDKTSIIQQVYKIHQNILQNNDPR